MMSSETIRAAELELIRGIRAGDIAYLERILHPDLLFIAPDGMVVTKEMDLASYKRGDMVVEALTPTFEDIRILGDHATVIVVYDTRGSMLGHPIQGRFRYIRFWKEFPGGIQVMGGACSALAAP
jgi:hypothetical protein